MPLLEYATPTGLVRPGPARLASWSFAGAVETRQMRFRVIGEGDKPLANVGVSLTGEGFPQEGRTDKKGEVTMPLIGLPGKRARSLFASSPSNYWDHYLTEPELLDGEVNVVRLRPIDETIAGFPAHYRYGWGQLQMGLDRVSETLGGKGVKVAIVDSGVDTTHPLLRHIHLGLDLTSPADPHAWTQDIIGHGSHAAGIIAARDESGKMLRGFVPDAEIHVLKVFPGGRLSSLLEALDYCLEREIDIVNLSLGTLQPSQAIEQKLEEAALHGIACIVAAGSSGGPVQYPASSPYTLAVGAVGRLNEYPDETWDATTVLPNLIAADGIFSPSFSCTGPEVAVCAPGVAIVSTVPGGFEPQSGTSTAAPHVTGLAALLLAHHPAFSGAAQISESAAGGGALQHDPLAVRSVRLRRRAHRRRAAPAPRGRANLTGEPRGRRGSGPAPPETARPPRAIRRLRWPCPACPSTSPLAVCWARWRQPRLPRRSTRRICRRSTFSQRWSPRHGRSRPCSSPCGGNTSGTERRRRRRSRARRPASGAVSRAACVSAARRGAIGPVQSLDVAPLRGSTRRRKRQKLLQPYRRRPSTERPTADGPSKRRAANARSRPRS